VRFVAVPDARPDYSGTAERALVERVPPYLVERARLPHWRVFEVRRPTPLVAPERGAAIDLVRLGSDEVALRVRRPGAALVRVRWTPYLRAPGACVERAGEWTRVIAPQAGELRMGVAFSPTRIGAGGRLCAARGCG
jgi:hypothetical protein